MAAIQQSVRDNVVYASGFLKGRSYTVPTSFSELYGSTVSSISKLVSLPLPFLSILALPFFGSTSTTVSLGALYLTWISLVLSRDQLSLELYGTLTIRLLFFVIPALGFLGFDCALPSFARSMKNRGSSQSPLVLGRKKLLEIVGISLLNVGIGLLLQTVLEVLLTNVLHLKSIVKVSLFVPLPLTVLKDLAKGFAIRGALIYAVHRFVLHTYDTPLKTWHRQWQHSVRLPFSLAAAYDHPLNYLLSQWLPTLVPAYLFRFHILTWHLFVTLTSVEDLFVFSGYNTLPSRIILLGMSRRCDEHFAVVAEGKEVGNFGRTGIMDLIFRTTCAGEDDAMDDIQQEAEKHQVQERAEAAKDGAVAGLKKGAKPKTRARKKS